MWVEPMAPRSGRHSFTPVSRARHSAKGARSTMTVGSSATAGVRLTCTAAWSGKSALHAASTSMGFLYGKSKVRPGDDYSFRDREDRHLAQITAEIPAVARNPASREHLRLLG